LSRRKARLKPVKEKNISLISGPDRNSPENRGKLTIPHKGIIPGKGEKGTTGGKKRMWAVEVSTRDVGDEEN